VCGGVQDAVNQWSPLHRAMLYATGDVAVQMVRELGANPLAADRVRVELSPRAPVRCCMSSSAVVSCAGRDANVRAFEAALGIEPDTPTVVRASPSPAGAGRRRRCG